MSVQPSHEPEHGSELEAWRAAYRETVSGEGREPCLEAEALAELAIGELGGAERDRRAAHVVRCSRCAERYRLLRELHREAGGVRAGASRQGLLAAAALIVMLGGALLIGLWLGVLGTGGPDAGSGQEVLRDRGDAVEPADQALLDGAPVVLRWRPEPSASGARVRLFDAAGEPLWEGSAEAGRVELPAEVRDRLRAGESYFWIVDVEGGVSRPRLGPFWFRIAG